MTERNNGIDLLRSVSMLFVIILHICTGGGLYGNTEIPSVQNYFIYFLQSLTFCAVNCYAIISGFVSVKNKYRPHKIIILWLEVVFYTGIIALIVKLVAPQYVGPEHLRMTFFPVTSNNYWYFTCYFALFLLMPFINRLLKSLDKKQLNYFVFILFLIMNILPIIAKKDIFKFGSGYSLIWLMYMYIIGGFFALNGLPKRYNNALNMVFYLLSCLSIWFINFLWISGGMVNAELERLSYTFLSYISLPSVLSAIFLFLFFARLKLSSSPVISFFGAASFGVYILQTNSFVWELLLVSRFSFLAQYPILKMSAFILLTAISVYLIGSVIEFIRNKIFFMLKIKTLALKIEKHLSSFVEEL